MKKRVAAVLGLALLAGCEAGSPTMNAEVAGPAFDGGVMFGSGHRSGDSTSTTTTQSGNADTQQQSGGVMFGSGH